jgi:hypothetical protein
MSDPRWHKLIEKIEAAGFVRDWGGDQPRTYQTHDEWWGYGSSYITLTDNERDAQVKVRISDHAPVRGGGLRWQGEDLGWWRAGEADVSIHPSSAVTLRNVIAHIEAALAEGNT